MADPAALAQFAAVQIWIGAVGINTGDGRLEILWRFVEQTATTPDEMIAQCLRPLPDGQKKLSFKARRHWVEQIDTFEQGNGGRPAGNTVRSFFIQNGVPIQSSILV